MAEFVQAKSTVIAHAHVTNPESVEGTAVDVRTFLSGLLTLRHAYIEAVDPGGIEPEFHIMGSLDQTGTPPDDSWFKILSVKAVDPGAAPATEAMTATEPVTETVLAVASTTGFGAGNDIYIQDTTTAADSEWHLVDRIVANVSIEIFMGLTNQKDSADVIWGSAQTFRIALDLSGLGAINVHYSNEGASAPNTAVLVEFLAATDIL